MRTGGVNISELTDEEFAAWVGKTQKDAHLTGHTSFGANQLLNGSARHDQQMADLLSDAEVVTWAQANLGLHCESVEQMAGATEAAADCDVLRAAGQGELGLNYFAAKAGALGTPWVQYDFGKIQNPWKSDRAAVADLRESFDRQRSALYWTKRRLAEEDACHNAEEVGAGQSKRPEQKAKSNAASKNAPKCKAAAKKK